MISIRNSNKTLVTDYVTNLLHKFSNKIILSWDSREDLFYFRSPRISPSWNIIFYSALCRFMIVFDRLKENIVTNLLVWAVYFLTIHIIFQHFKMFFPIGDVRDLRHTNLSFIFHGSRTLCKCSRKKKQTKKEKKNRIKNK